MGRTLEGMLDELDSDAERFYMEIIPLHNDQRLRSLVRKHRIMAVVPPEPYCSDKPKLYYDSEGFRASVPYWVSDDWRDGWYNHEDCAFREKDGRLVCDVEEGGYKGRQEMLELFPELTAVEVKMRLESEVEEYVARRASRGR